MKRAQGKIDLSIVVSEGLKALLIIYLTLAAIFVSPLSAFAESGGTIRLPVVVAFDGSGLPEVTFRLELRDENGNSRVEETTLSNLKRSGTVYFDVSAGDGASVYTLSEIPGDAPGVRFSERVYTLTVEKGSDGGVFISRVETGEEQSGKPEKLVFENEYTVKPGVLGDPPVRVQKKIGGGKPERDETFVFVMQPADESYPLPEGAVNGVREVTIEGEGEVEIGNVYFIEPGIYRYFVYERNDGKKDYVYDVSRFEVVYTVTEGVGGELYCDRQIIREREVVNACVFKNEYTGGGVDTPSTGDPDTPGLYETLSALSASGLAFVAFIGRREKKKQKRTAEK